MVLVAIAGLGGIASAQPNDPGGTTDVAPIAPPTPPTPPTTPTPPPTVDADGTAVTPTEAVVNGERPAELAFAIGIGYVRPPGGSMDLQTPNIASVRLRLINGITFEPTITISNSSNEVDQATTQTTDSITEFGIGSLVRFPVIKHGRFDFEALGSLGFDILKDNPDGDYNTKTTTTFNLGWGIAIGYWFSHHLQMSASATNSLVSYSAQNQETSQSTSTKTSTTTFGLTFDPTIFLMLHLYN